MAMRTRVGSVIPLVVVGGLVMWGWGSSAPEPRGTESPPSLLPASEAAGDPQALLVDFKDDVGEQTLAKNAWTEEALTEYSAVDRLYRLRFPSAADAARAAAALRADPTVESVEYEAEMAIPPGELEATAAAPNGDFSECSNTAGTEDRGFPND